MRPHLRLLGCGPCAILVGATPAPRARSPHHGAARRGRPSPRVDRDSGHVSREAPGGPRAARRHSPPTANRAVAAPAGLGQAASARNRDGVSDRPRSGHAPREVADQYGEVSRQPAWQEPLALRLDLGRGDVPCRTPLGTTFGRRRRSARLHERETTKAADAVFGDDEGSVTLGSMGRLLFHAVLQVNDYLQSVSADARTRDITGRS